MNRIKNFARLFLVSVSVAACSGGGNSTDAENGAVTAPTVGVQTQSSYAKGDQTLSTVVNQVQQNYQQQAQNGQ